MSLINDALKKLQASNGGKAPYPSMMHRHLSHDKTNIHIQIYVFIFVILLAIFSGGFIFYKHRINENFHMEEKNTIFNNKSQISASPQEKFVSENNKPIENPQVQIDTLFHDALDNVKNNQLAVAIKQLGQVVNLSPGFNKARELRIALLIQSNQLTAAQKTLTQGLAISPNYIPFIQMQAHFLMDKEKYDDALSILEEFSPNFKDYQDYYVLKASLDETLGRYEDAIVLYRTLIKDDPENGKLWLGLGMAYQGVEKISEANDAFERALSFGGLSKDQQLYATEQLGRA